MSNAFERTADLGNGSDLRLAPTATGMQFVVMARDAKFGVYFTKLFDKWKDANEFFEEFYKENCDVSHDYEEV